MMQESIIVAGSTEKTRDDLGALFNGLGFLFICMYHKLD